MGKSRLVAEVMRHTHTLGFAIFAGECESYGTNSSYLVWQDLARAVGGGQRARRTKCGEMAVTEP